MKAVTDPPMRFGSRNEFKPVKPSFVQISIEAHDRNRSSSSSVIVAAER